MSYRGFGRGAARTPEWRQMRISADIQFRIFPMGVCDNILAFAKEGEAVGADAYGVDYAGVSAG